MSVVHQGIMVKNRTSLYTIEHNNKTYIVPFLSLRTEKAIILLESYLLINF